MKYTDAGAIELLAERFVVSARRRRDRLEKFRPFVVDRGNDFFAPSANGGVDNGGRQWLLIEEGGCMGDIEN